MDGPLCDTLVVSKAEFKLRYEGFVIFKFRRYEKIVLKRRLKQAFPLDIRKKTQGEKNSELKKKTQTQAKNSTFRHFSNKYSYN